VVNEVIEFELVDLAGVELDKSSADVFEQGPELLLVVCGDHLPGGSALPLVVRRRRSPGKRHGSTLPRSHDS